MTRGRRCCITISSLEGNVRLWFSTLQSQRLPFSTTKDLNFKYYVVKIGFLSKQRLYINVKNVKHELYNDWIVKYDLWHTTASQLWLKSQQVHSLLRRTLTPTYSQTRILDIALYTPIGIRTFDKRCGWYEHRSRMII